MLIGLFTLLVASFLYFPAFKITTNDSSKALKHLIFKTSGFWILNETIEIDEQGTNNWDSFIDKAWCSGSGTPGDPYIIENVTINANKTGSCITILNSNVNFIIRNCTLLNSSIGGTIYNREAGIRLVSVSNGQVINNNCSFNEVGIFLEDGCFDNTISGNQASNNNASGIELHENCYDNLFSSNEIHDNSDFGIHLLTTCSNNTFIYNNASRTLFGTQNRGIALYEQCNENSILENYCNDNDYAGISLINSCENNFITGNNASNIINRTQEIGIYVNIGCNNNVLSKNNASNNNDHGIYIYDNCNENIITENTAFNNSQNGFYMWDFCHSNIISENNFTENDDHGVYLNVNCSDNNLYNNIASNTYSDRQGQGFCLEGYCHNNTLYNNIACDNGYEGIYLDNCENITISRNRLGNDFSINQETGIYITNSTNNTIKNNFCKDQTIRGLYMEGSDYNDVWGNGFVNNDQRGIHLNVDSDNNTMWLNTFLNNNLNNSVNEGSYNNYWDNGEVGNYWDDYTGEFYTNGTGMESYYIKDWTEAPSGEDRHPIGDTTPDPNFSVNQTLLFTGEWIQCTYTGFGGNLPLFFDWDFGDETEHSDEENPLHRYDVSGNFTVRLILIDATGEEIWVTKENHVIVEEDTIPVLEFSESIVRGVRGREILFECKISGGNGPFSYEWNFGDYTPTSNETSPSHAFSNVNKYNVTLTIIDRDGDSVNATISVEIRSISTSDNTILWIILSTLAISGFAGLAGAILILRKRKKNGVSSVLESVQSSGHKLPKKLDNLKNRETPGGIDPTTHKLIFDGSIEQDTNSLPDQKAELAKTESELQIQKQEFLCLVHKGPVKGVNVYICPHCGAFYCRECAKALSEKGESCWACRGNLEI